MYNRIRLLVAVLLDLNCQAEARKVITLRCRFVFVYARGLEDCAGWKFAHNIYIHISIQVNPRHLDFSNAACSSLARTTTTSST